MTIEIRDASLEARIRKQLQATGSTSVEEVLLRLLDTQEEQDRWLLENRAEINAKIRRGIAQLDRGEGIPEDQLDACLARLKARLWLSSVRKIEHLSRATQANPSLARQRNSKPSAFR